MTREEALKILKEPDRVGVNIIKANDEESCEYNAKSYVALDMAIKALEQEPCEDAISREDVLDEINRIGANAFDTYSDYSNLFDFVSLLSPVQPKQTECEDAISRSETIKYLNTNMAWYDEDGEMADSDEKLKAITDLINGVPSVHSKPKTGRWIHLKHNKGKCSKCHDVVLTAQQYGNANYCPNCGAKMVEPQESLEELKNDGE